MTYQAIPAGTASSVPAWISAEANFLKGKIPQLTEFSGMLLGQQPTGTTAAPGPVPDPAVIGGGLSVGAAATRVLGSSIYQSLTAEYWGFIFRAKFAAPTSGHTAYVGIQSLAGPGTHAIVVGSIFAGDAVNYVFKLFGTSTVTVSTTFVADTNFHDFAIVSDKSTATVWIDGISSASVTGSNFTNGVVGGEANQAMIFNSTTTEAIASKFVYGYVAP